ncbi:MAG: cysteine hydrolase [Candidatus Aenigmarchaeota archaeon]|nr:cysteine hydrolase [Candidatus Aenigmarchaeota archaeon]
MNLPEKQCLLVIDMQRDFLASDGYYVKSGKDIGPMLKAKENIEAQIHESQGKMLVVYVVSQYFLGQFGEGKSICVKGTKGSKLVIDKKFADAVIVKQGYSAFSNPSLLALLKKHSITTLTIVGLTTENCIRSTALDALGLGFRVIVPEECVATNRERTALHEAALKEIEQRIQGKDVASRSVARSR